MVAFVVTADGIAQARFFVRDGEFEKLDFGISGEGSGNPAKIPGAIKIQPDEVDEMAVFKVAHGDRGGEVSEVESGEEFLKPSAVVGRREDAAHEVGFVETGREEVISARFVADGIGDVFEVEGLCFLYKEGFEFGIAGGAGPVEHLREGEGGFGMEATADGPVELRKVGLGIGDDRLLDGEVGGGPLCALFIIEGAEFDPETQGPGPAIHALEPDIGLEMIRFFLKSLGGELFGEFGADFFIPRSFRKKSDEPDEGPVSMNGGVPIEVTEEDGRDLARRAGISGGAQDVAGFVGKLAVESRQGEVDEAGGIRLGDPVLGVERHEGKKEEEEEGFHHINSIEVNFFRR